MALYPEVQRAAHAEIDAVLGDSRLPDFSDEDELPYVSAVLKEVLRWHPVAPLGESNIVNLQSHMELIPACASGIPHRVTKGDTYKGYFIPAGSIVIGNGWYAALPPLSGGIDLNLNLYFFFLFLFSGR